VGRSTFIVDCAARLLRHEGRSFRCAIGRSGAVPAATKCEGDGATPIGVWPLLGALIRPGCGFEPPPRLPWRWLRPGDGWSDDPADPAYNRPVVHPHRFSAERLWRADGLYDVIIATGHNAGGVPGRGSAIFWHLAGPGYPSTEGCVAVGREDMAWLLPILDAGSLLDIRAG
jgi:L,D-peptidoglycan transpeptidase YkuD (ErfK/YbiS/YcfS/YnhG family)